MVNVRQLLDILRFKVTEGFEYPYESFCEDAYCVARVTDQYEISMVFSPSTTRVYQVSCTNYVDEIIHEWVHPQHNIPIELAEKLPHFKYNSMTEQDIPDVVKNTLDSSIEDQQHDISLEIDDSLLLQIMRAAHEHNMTFNDYVNMMLLDHANQVLSQST